LWCDTESPLASTTAPDPRIAQAQEYLCEHLKTTVSLDDVAAEVGLSVSRLSYLFRRETRLTPQRYYEQQRLERAKQLLEITDLPIKQIAAEVGFANPFYFTLRFKAATGQSPRAYRRRKGG
ncbi:MAG: helix-turn-helix domain-containing protein, partial [Tepidisphaeraceae bacterium]